MDRRLVAVLLCLSVVATGCVSPGSWSGAEETTREATVVRVVDGDTVEVRYVGGDADTVRLLGIDAPEVGGRNAPGEFEGVPDTEAGRQCLADAGRDATAAAERWLAGGTVRVVVDRAADRRDRYDRLLAYLVLPNGTDVNYRLVAGGHARVYDAPFSRSDRYYAAEAEVRAAGRGLWTCRDPSTANRSGPLAVVTVHADAAGDDHRNLDDEYVVFRNTGGEPLALTGWTVRDDAGHVYQFPDGFHLQPNATVTLYSGTGADEADAVYWDSEEAIWNNDGDRIVVRNASGAVVNRHRYR